jgi:signal transduction histidine kinase
MGLSSMSPGSTFLPAERAWRRALSFPPQFAAVLSETAELLLSDADPDTLCQAVFARLQEPFDVDVYFHYLMKADGSGLELASAGGRAGREIIGSHLDLDQAVCGKVAKTCSPMYFTDIQDRTDETTALTRSMGVSTYACFPLRMRAHTLGTLSFGSTVRTSFTEQEVELFSLVAQQVTLATDRRAQHARLRQLERLATAGRLSATLAHEINNPLESLSNLMYLLKDNVHSKEGLELLQIADAQVLRLSDTVQRTLRMFRGDQAPLQQVVLSEVVRDLTAGLTLPNHVRLEEHIEEGLQVCMNPGELRQVLFNLLTNAAHFTPLGAAVTLTVHRVGEWAEIRVRDEGEGISEKSRPRIFQPFYTTRANEGTGVGLWLSKNMLERAGGQLTFESDAAVRRGTEFIATLPLVNDVLPG